jgi:hypothetical protein
MTKPEPDIKEVLTLADVAARWTCSETSVMRRVKDTSNPLPFFSLTVQRGEKSKRGAIRFRLAAIRQWELQQERIIIAPDPIEAPGRPAHYTGPDRIAARLRKQDERRKAREEKARKSN